MTDNTIHGKGTEFESVNTPHVYKCGHVRYTLTLVSQLESEREHSRVTMCNECIIKSYLG